ncbi:NRAMP (natural resistance-associated macrophage protein) metal ion transporters [Fodinibius roseus]|uniref:NRAMP (Natural resistance-associated macrophage protein) metal ion transporters n=1 Tax=Fodinibius roseus TaxID=1194090 RepID=A0A1M5IQL2_9BACT|nr:Nramp family divalent metal transporter [Fodinibius roseus]SHG30319.1 NRAMP (natural resistance-associated macrophage protein) metal ion transporters [Fodinibius roseus]
MTNDNDKDVSTITKKWLAYLGPGIITAALVFGPGSLTITSKLGAIYEYELLWVIIISTILMMAFTGMGARIGIATEHSLLQSFKKRWGKWASLFTGVGIFLVTVSFQAGNAVAAGVAFAEPLGTSTVPWILLVLVCGILLLFFKSFYKVLEKVMILMVGIMLVSFLLTLIITQPDVTQVVQGAVPSIPAGSLLLVVALVASSFSIVGAFYQSYLVQEKGWKSGEVKKVVKESFSGIFILGCISAMILVGSGAILYPQGIEVNSASDMGLALQPLFGNWAVSLFMLGLFGASFSSLIGNATIGGTLLADALSLGSDLSSKPVRICISLIMIAGATIAIIFGKLPLELIVFAQGITIFIVPFIGAGIFILANDKDLMGALVNKKFDNLLGIIGLLVLFGLAFGNFKNLFL